jgi:hypothetical protein
VGEGQLWIETRIAVAQGCSRHMEPSLRVGGVPLPSIGPLDVHDGWSGMNPQLWVWLKPALTLLRNLRGMRNSTTLQR